MTGLVLLLLGGLCVAAWWQLMRGRHVARAAAASSCKQHELQLLDDTVSLQGVHLSSPKTFSRFTIRYGFEFTTNGAMRRQGFVDLGWSRRLSVSLETEHGTLIEEFVRREAP